MFRIVLPAPLGPQQLNTAVKVIGVLVIIVMLQKGHHNLLTCLNEVPATFDINYVHPGSVLGRRRRCFVEAVYIPLLPCRGQISTLPPDVGAVRTFASHSEALLV